MIPSPEHGARWGSFPLPQTRLSSTHPCAGVWIEHTGQYVTVNTFRWCGAACCRCCFAAWRAESRSCVCRAGVVGVLIGPDRSCRRPAIMRSASLLLDESHWESKKTPSASISWGISDTHLRHNFPSSFFPSSLGLCTDRQDFVDLNTRVVSCRRKFRSDESRRAFDHVSQCLALWIDAGGQTRCARPPSNCPFLQSACLTVYISANILAPHEAWTRNPIAPFA
jgi:hypothetical protein